MHDSNEFHVIVIGAGIVGCYAAAALSLLGYRVCVLEKNAEAGTKSSCTGIISGECLDLLPAGRAAIQFQASSAKIFSPAGNFIRVEREAPQAYILDRPALDRAMASQAIENGARLYFSTQASSIRIDGRFAEVKAACLNGAAVFRADIVLIASGAGIAVTRYAGLGQIQEFAQGAQAEVPCNELEEVEVYTGADMAPGFFAWLVPAGKSRAKAGLLCRGNPQPHMAAFLNRLERQGRINAGNHKVKYGLVPLKPLARTYGQHLLVIGDAAGQVKPTTGGGIYFGTICAGLAVKTVQEALNAGDVSAGSLSSYQRRWHKLLKRELSIDYWAHRFYSGLNDKQMEHIFNVIERHGIHESILASPDITFDWHGKTILDALRYRSLQRSLEKLGMTAIPPGTGDNPRKSKP